MANLKRQLEKCFLIEFSTKGSQDLGYISIAENKEEIPFNVKRVYWTYFTPQNVIRGRHAHINLKQLIIAVSGVLKFKLERLDGFKQEFMLDNPNVGLYIPPLFWREITFSHNAVLLCLASEKYSENDYVRSYERFKKLNSVG